MPLYDYRCNECGYSMVDVYQHITDNSLNICPSCNQESLERIIYGGIYASVKEVKTIGQLADKNWKDIGHYKRTEISSQQREKQPQTVFPEAGKASRKDIAKMTEQQRTNYIMTGEK
jgi:putative FmdB family regulatory protein